MRARAVVDRLEAAIGVDGRPQRLLLAIEEVLFQHGKLSKLEASERAERVQGAVAQIIAERAAFAEQHGTLAPLILIGSTADSVAGFAHALPTDVGVVAAAKQYRRQVTSLLTAIQQLHFSEFERFGARVLILMGAAAAHITPHAGDQGIDFYGHLTLGQYSGMPEPFMRLAHDVKLSFAGQAKHYPKGALGPNFVRELVGAVSLARSRTFSTASKSLFDDANFKPFAPIVLMLFSTGAISTGARQLADSAGVIVRSGEQLAVFLADHGVAMTDEGGIKMFDPTAFAAWISDPV